MAQVRRVLDRRERTHGEYAVRLCRKYTGKISTGENARKVWKGIPRGNMQRKHAQKFTRIQRDFTEKKKREVREKSLCKALLRKPRSKTIFKSILWAEKLIFKKRLGISPWWQGNYHNNHSSQLVLNDHYMVSSVLRTWPAFHHLIFTENLYVLKSLLIS